METSRVDRFFKFIKTTFFFLLLLLIIPSIITMLKTVGADLFSAKEQIGLLVINGDIDDSTFYAKKITQFAKNPDIKGVLVKIDSGGGHPGPGQTLFMELRKFKEKKPVVVVVENVCASAAYYIAMAAHKIIAAPSALVGSIGVLTQIPNIKELLDSWKIHVYYASAGKYKTSGSPLKQLSPDEIAYFQNISDESYRQFTKDVAAARGLEINECARWGDGKIFTGNQALELGLIDKIGTFYDAVEELKKLAHIEDEVKLVRAKRPHNVLRALWGDDDEVSNESKTWASSVAMFLHQVSQKLHAQESTIELR